jgi:ABC-2 type transport system permease protein
MAVYKRTYKPYDGPQTPAWSRFYVISRYTFSTLFKSRIFTAFTVLCFFPVLIGIAYIYFLHSGTAQMLLSVNVRSTLTINNFWFATFLQVQAWLGFWLVTAAAPGMVSRDFANHGIQLYLSRPISRTEYLLGKLTVLACLLSCTTWVPGLLLFSLNAGLEGSSWAWENSYLVGSIILSGFLWIAVISFVCLALSVWVKSRIAGTGLILGIFFLLPGFGRAMDVILRTEWGRLFSLGYALQVVWLHLYRIDATNPRYLRAFKADVVPLWSALATVLVACAASLLLLNRRLKAREVERG